MPGLPPPHEIARLRRQLERAVEEKRPDRVREAMGEVVSVLVRSLPLALPAPVAPSPAARPPDAPRAWAEPSVARVEPRTALSPREELAKIIREWEALAPPPAVDLTRAQRAPERLMERLRRSAGALPDRPSWSALPWTEAADEPAMKRLRRF